MNEKERLIEELEKIGDDSGRMYEFIIARERHIVEPLVKLSKERTYILMARTMGLTAWHKAIVETLKRAGLCHQN